MNVMMIRAKVKPEKVAEAEAGAEKVFAAIHRARPEGVRYASTKLPDGQTFVILLALEGRDNPLTALPEFNEFQEGIKGWLAEPPTPEPLAVVGSYQLFD